MSFSSIISAIGNNNTIYPLIIRDCGIEAPTKIALTYNQNRENKYIAKNALRERAIDEFATSLVWLGGIPLIELIINKIIKKKGFNPNVNLKLFKDEQYQGIDYNIKKFQKLAPNAVEDLKKVKLNKSLFEKMLGTKFIFAVGIPTFLMGFVLPKLNFALSKKIMQKNNKNEIRNPAIPAFKGSFVSALANMSTVQKMATTDGGLTIGRVSTSRNPYEAIDNTVKMLGMLFLNYIAPKQIAKFLDKFVGKISNSNVKLDPIILDDKEFLKSVKNSSLKLPKSSNQRDIFAFIDSNPKALYTKLAVKLNIIKMFNENVRDPRYYVETKKLIKLKNEIEEFSKDALESANFEKFVKKSKNIKSINIGLNVLISSGLLAIGLPKFQFAIRKLITGSKLEPGLIKNENYKKDKK